MAVPGYSESESESTGIRKSCNSWNYLGCDSISSTTAPINRAYTIFLIRNRQLTSPHHARFPRCYYALVYKLEDYVTANDFEQYFNSNTKVVTSVVYI